MTNPELSREQLLELLDLQTVWGAAQETLRQTQDICKTSTGADLVCALRVRARAGEASAAAASAYFNARASMMESILQPQNSSDV